MKGRKFIGGLSTLAVSLPHLRAAETGDKPLLSFGLITDLQDADAEPEKKRHFPESLPKLKTSVAAYCNGHWHSGAEEIRNGVPYITFKSILRNPGVNAYSAIHLFADRLQIEGNGREQSRVIPLKRI